MQPGYVPISFPSWAFSVLTLIKKKGSQLTNTSRPSREPLLLITETLTIWRQTTDWMGINTSMICAVPFTLCYRLHFCFSRAHTPSFSLRTRPVCCDNVIWYGGPGIRHDVCHLSLDSVAMTLFCHTLCLCSMSIALIEVLKSSF